MNARVETLRIGIIGTGNIGTSHARSLSREVSGAEVAWLYDADTARASTLADELGALVRDVEVDAVQTVLLHFEVDGAGHDVTRGQLGARVVLRHEARAPGRFG